jgi:hypothetical protein
MAPPSIPRCLGAADLRHLRGGTPKRPPQGRPCQTPCSHAGRSGCLLHYVSIKTMTQFSSLFWASNHSCCLLQCLGTILRERLWHHLVFFVVSTCWETCFSSHHYSTSLFFSFFFGSSYRPSCLPRCSDTTLWVRPWRSLNFFVIVSIYWKSSSYKSSLDHTMFGKTKNRSAAKLASFFFFGPTCTLFDLSIALWLCHDLLRSLRLHIARGLVRHGYPWVPTDHAHDHPRQVGPAHQKTCRPISRPARPDM